MVRYARHVPVVHNGDMCGRFTLTTSSEALRAHFGLAGLPAPLAPRYNIAPSQDIAAVRQGAGGRELILLRWGLVPSWAKEAKTDFSMINARAETVAVKPAYRTAFRRRRCLIPADGFYEWRTADGKQPYRFTVEGGLFAFAGLWERWQGPTGEVVESCTILVTDANELVRQVHERMPVIIDPADYAFWLDPAITEPEALRPLLAPFPADRMRGYPVGRKVNRSDYDAPDAIEATGPELTA